VSPILANLFLHYAFDVWMTRTYPAVPFERYADDAICHCRTQSEAEALRAALAERFATCGLALHPQKTKIVYCADTNRNGRGGTPDPYDTNWIDDDAELRRTAADPTEVVRISAAFAMVVGDGRRDRLERLLAAGLRIPPVLTGCQGYLLAHTDMLRTLLANGMSPDVMNWQHQTLLHHVCVSQDYRGRDRTDGAIERAAILLDAGASISAREHEYRSTPLAWAARTNALEVAAFLLSRHAPANLPDDEPWATPLAWATRRGHAQMSALLRRHGAVR
jgi:hypothetical protein